MGLAEDLPLIAGVGLILIGLAYGVTAAGLPGIGSFDNPFDDVWSSDPGSDADTYDLRSQFSVSASALGGVTISGFTYQTPESGFSLSTIGSSGNLALTGANDVRVTRKLTNEDTGKIYLSDTLQFNEVAGGETITVNTDADNLKPGDYTLNVEVVYDPEWYDIGDLDNTKTREYNIQVPKNY